MFVIYIVNLCCRNLLRCVKKSQVGDFLPVVMPSTEGLPHKEDMNRDNSSDGINDQ